MVGLCATHVVRLCVSSNRETEDVHANLDAMKDAIDDGGVENEAISTDDEDYSVYGRVRHEDEDGKIDVTPTKRKYCEVGNGWSVELRDTYSSKVELKRRLRMLAVKQQFLLKIKKSTKNLFVTVCWCHRCKWRVRATTRDDHSKILCIMVYRSVHTCGTGDRFAKSALLSPKYMAKMFMSRVGIIDGLTAKHIKDSMKAAFGIDMNYWTSYTTLISAQELERGTPELGYEQLPSYLQQLKKN